MSDYEWRRSSFCASGACVLVAGEFGGVVVSDSKLGDASSFRGFSSGGWARVLEDIRNGFLPDGVTRPTYGTVAWGVLRFTNDEWDAFVAGVHNGEFDYDKLSSGDEAGSGFRGVARSGQNAATGAGAIAVPPVPVAAHHQTAGWGGGPGECGVECACGTTFENFDTIAEAAALLDDHIAAANSPVETPEQSAAIVDANLRGMGSRGLDPVPVAADRQIATIKTHFTRRIDTLKARAERAERELEEARAEAATLTDQLGDMRATVSAAEADRDAVAAQPRYILDKDAILELVQRYGEACKSVTKTYFGDVTDHRTAKANAADLLEAIRGALTPVPDVEPEPAWGSGPLVEHVTETPGTEPEGAQQ